VKVKVRGGEGRISRGNWGNVEGGVHEQAEKGRINGPGKKVKRGGAAISRKNKKKGEKLEPAQILSSIHHGCHGEKKQI